MFSGNDDSKTTPSIASPSISPQQQVGGQSNQIGGNAPVDRLNAHLLLSVQAINRLKNTLSGNG